jgi:hypothetical protein
MQLQTTALLAANGVFTSGKINAASELGPNLNIEVESAQASATNGLVVSASLDGTNFHPVYEATVAAGVPLTASIKAIAPWYQITYTNGTTAQTNMFLVAGFSQ